MAFDVGRKRVGIAVPDPDRIIANGLDTLLIHEVLPYVRPYSEKENVDLFVIGYARQASGEDSESMAYISPFYNSLRNKFPLLPAEWVDERCTSQLDFRAML